MPMAEDFAFGVGRRRNRAGAYPHWCPRWVQLAEIAANELGFEFRRVEGGIRLRTAEQRDQVVLKTERLWEMENAQRLTQSSGAE